MAGSSETQSSDHSHDVRPAQPEDQDTPATVQPESGAPKAHAASGDLPTRAATAGQEDAAVRSEAGHPAAKQPDDASPGQQQEPQQEHSVARQLPDTACSCASAGAPPAAASKDAAVEDVECRICLMSDSRSNLVTPCKCMGTVAHAHLACLLRWCEERVSTQCEICGSVYRAEVLPLLEAAVKEQQRNQQRVAELVRQNLRRAEEAVAAGQAHGSPDRAGRAGTASNWLVLKVLLVLAVTGGLLYAIFFLGSQDSGTTWAAVVLRVLIFIIPVYLVYRAISACFSYRSQFASRPQSDPDDEREERRPAFAGAV